MFLNPALSAALDRITERAADVRRAFTPGAVPSHDDVATPRPKSDFTIDPLAVAAADGYYFITRDARGELGYTRDGSFSLRNGHLEDGDGQAVCALGQRDGELRTLELDPVDLALGRVSGAAIERDGSVTYRRVAINPRTAAAEAQRVVVGRIALARFPAGTRLAAGEGGRETPPAGVVAEIVASGRANVPYLEPMHRERSRVDIDASLTKLKEAYLAFDALHAAENAKGRLGKTAMDLVK